MADTRDLLDQMGYPAAGCTHQVSPRGEPRLEVTTRSRATAAGRSGKEVSIRERMPGTGLEVVLETAGQVAGFEGDVELDLPGAVSGCMSTLASIVLGKSRSQVGGMAGVAFAGMLEALQDVGVEHGCSLREASAGRRNSR